MIEAHKITGMPNTEYQTPNTYFRRGLAHILTLNKLNKAVSYKMRVYEELKSAIINEKLKPGEVLNERKIAEELGISRTPVREAIQMLENEGWVNTEPWKGSYVVNITNQDVEEIFQLRRTLESLVIELIVPKIGELEINKIEELINKQSRYCKEYNAENFIYKDRDFHMYLVHLTNNKRLKNT